MHGIISLGEFPRKCNEIMMLGLFLWIYEKYGKLLMKVKQSPNHLYKINLSIVSQMCLTSETCEPSWLWHARLGHVKFPELKLV